MQFTDAETAFIEAAIPTLQAAERELIAHEEFETAVAEQNRCGEALGEQGQNIDYVHRLLLAAANRAGYAADSEVVRTINEAYEEVRAYVELVNDAALEALNSGGPTL
jgi:hypothetical protein